MTGYNLACFNLNIYGPEVALEDVSPLSTSNQQDKRVLANLPAMLEAVEEDLTKLLPPGYSAVIREWSSDE